MIANAFILIASVADSLVGAIAMPWRSKTSLERAPLHPLRRMLLDLIRRRPGARLLDLWKELDVHRGTANYNLEILRRVGAIQVVRSDGATRFFPADFSPRDARQFTLLLRGYVLQVVREILARPGIYQDRLVQTLDISRKVFRTYANLLKEEGLLEERRHGKRQQYYATPQLHRLYARITEAAPDADPPEAERP